MLLPKYAKVELSPEYCARLLQTAHLAADAASVPTMANFRRPVKVENKEAPGSFDPVTIADRQAEQAIKDVVLGEFPEHGFFGEESARQLKDNQPLWVVDPIDGTRAYITGVPLWGTLIAVYDGAEVVLGMLEQPFMRERFVGIGAGTAFGNAQYMNSGSQLITYSGTKQLSTRSSVSLSQAIMQTTSPEFFKQKKNREAFDRVEDAVSMVRFGGDCYCYALLAMGFVDVVIETGLQPYDIAALVPIVEGAGGVISTWDGESAASGGSVVACGSRQLHNQVLSLLA